MDKKDLKLALRGMKDEGMSQRKLARILQLDERTIRRYVAGDLPIPRVVSLAVEYVADNIDLWDRLEKQ